MQGWQDIVLPRLQQIFQLQPVGWQVRGSTEH
jgi:hypothetical protein